MGAVPFWVDLGRGLPMALLPPLQHLGFGTSPWRLQGNATEACAQAEGGNILFLPRKSPVLALRVRKQHRTRCAAFGARWTLPRAGAQNRLISGAIRRPGRRVRAGRWPAPAAAVPLPGPAPHGSPPPLS